MKKESVMLGGLVLVPWSPIIFFMAYYGAPITMTLIFTLIAIASAWSLARQANKVL